MSDIKRVLAVAAPAVLAKLEALQSPAEMSFERATNGFTLEALVRRRAFDVIVAELPSPGLDPAAFLERLRNSNCASAKSPIVLLERKGHEADLERLAPELLELVTWCATVPQTLKVVADVLHISDRSSVRLLAETERVVDSVRSRQVCQTENISASGMLLRTRLDLAPSSVVPFSLQLPDDSNPIHGRGEVVRHTDDTTEGISGTGVRFFGLDGDGGSRLSAFLARQSD